MTEHRTTDHGEADDGYAGEVTLAVDGQAQTTAHAVLAARFDPLAGSVVWTGRVRTELPLGGEVVVGTPHGRARARAAERDVWGNTRLAGLDRPPFPVELLDGAVDG
ncbi:DUF4873 domain-containing protein [Geodermatophilus ruber]|uniref:DUF4873 domain-containing protein n=1 Tax=Geodermatophilus ruber TaxID=504800 RepID=A0A1I4HWV2_9ACTN|nr:DUF4873 domain-containing protein [Geodermatophilus ruber]SFL46350.1 protein of unknown function [Geodermatophilus ruber]